MQDMILDTLVQAVRRQSWYRKNANTIHAGIGALAGILTFIVSLELGLPAVVSGALVAGIQLLTVLGVKFTKNGHQTKQAADLVEAAKTLEDPGLEAERSRMGLTGKHRAEA